MNYLAHIFLARHNSELLTGSFIADGFKGASYKTLPAGIVQGIELHRAVDSHTDSHAEIRKLVKTLSPGLGRYTAVVVDVYGDYYLAKHFNRYADMPLHLFEQHVYNALMENIAFIPLRYRRMVQAIGFKGMLQKYAQLNSLEYVFKRLQKRISNGETLEHAVNVLKQEEVQITETFDTFFPDLILFSDNYWESDASVK